MIDFVFLYKKKETIVKGKFEDKVIDICKKFASLNEGVIPETKVYIYEGKKLNLKFTFAQQSESIPNDQKVEILVFDDPDKEGTIKITYDGKDNIIRFNKEEKISNVIGQFVSKFRINMQKVFFLYGGGTISNDDLEKTFTQVTKNVDTDNKMINLLAYNRESTLSEGSGSDDGKEENNDKNETKNDNKGDVETQKLSNKINNEKIFENNQEKILNVDNDNEKILNVDDNNEKICKSESLKIDAEEPDEKKEDIRKSSIYFQHWDELNIRKVYIIFMIQIFLIGLFSFLGCLFEINKAFNASTSTMLWTFIPTLIFIFIVDFSYFALFDEEPTCFFIFNILFVPLMTFYCYLLTDYTEILYIIFQLIIIFLDVLIMLLNTYIFRNSSGYWQNFVFPLIVNAIVLPLSFKLLDIGKTNIIVNISIISFTSIIYLLIVFVVINESSTFSVIMAIMAFNYGLFLPGTFLVSLILVCIYFILEQICKHCCKSCYESCCEDCSCCDCVCCDDCSCCDDCCDC